ncbi:uncharacterized protein LOC100177462 [Ciona intestinalis]
MKELEMEVVMTCQPPPNSEDKEKVVDNEETEILTMDVQPFVPQDTPASSTNTGICGLYNLGNTCYMNSTLQCLLHNSQLMEQMSLKSLRSENESGISGHFINLFKKYWSGDYSVIVPSEFKDQLSKIHTQFAGNGQHDGQELLALFLESLHQEIKGTTPIAPSLSIVSDETVKRKRTKSTESLDDGRPNNKRMDIVATNPHHTNLLTINSFFGKEKKTANVNVLSSEVECDEEATTDHSNKFPQTVCSRLNNGQLMGDTEITSPVPQQKKPMDQPNSQDITTGVELKKLQLTKYKQTNLLAELKRIDSETTSTPNFDKIFNDPVMQFKQSCTNSLLPTIQFSSNTPYSTLETPIFYSEIASPVFTSTFIPHENILNKKRKNQIHIPSLQSFDQDTLAVTALPPPPMDLAGQPLAPQKLYSLRRSNSIPNLCQNFRKSKKVDFYEPSFCVNGGGVENGFSNNERNFVCETDTSCGLQSISGDRGLLLTKFTNILVDENLEPTPGSSTIGGNCSDTMSNLRDDISSTSCSGDHNSNSIADKIWNTYIQANQSVVVDTFQGQLESTVVCSKCGFKSVTHEPFMYLSLPIPHALNRCLNMHVSPLDYTTQHFSVYAPRHGKVSDVQEQLIESYKHELHTTDFTNFVFCEVKGYSIMEILEGHMPLKNLNDKTRKLELIEFLKLKSENDEKAELLPTAANSSWNSCCICLDEFSDSELLQHQRESCPILICPTCLQNSVEHYGIENFSCPVCHTQCYPVTDFIPLPSCNQNRDVLVTISFTYLDEDNVVQVISEAKLLNTPTTVSWEVLYEAITKLTPPHLQDDFTLVLSTRDGTYCSRCQYPTTCRGCPLPQGENVTLQPGDNISCRFTVSPNLVNINQPPVAEINSTEDILTLEKCLSAFTKNEILDVDNPWYCPACCGHQVAEKQLRICRWPDTLIVYIKRFLYHSKNAVKVDDEVLFPMESFSPGQLSGTHPHNFKSYDLTACMSHFGGVYSGHYVAHCKHPVTGKWHLFNDENISEQTLSSKDSAGAYVLFYQHKRSYNTELV